MHLAASLPIASGRIATSAASAISAIASAPRLLLVIDAWKSAKPQEPIGTPTLAAESGGRKRSSGATVESPIPSLMAPARS